MNEDRAIDLIWAFGALILVGSALMARRIPFARAWRMALMWVLIFGVAFLLFAFRDDFGLVGQRLRAAIDPEAGIVSGETLRIPMSDDGHFWVRANVNGVEQRFLIDSGATTIVLSAEAAKAAGITSDEDQFASMVQTANGTVAAKRIRIDRLAVGPISRDSLAAITAPEFGDVNVLGMNFLSTLSGWGVERRTLILKP
jgi:aspartyl protease family protein